MKAVVFHGIGGIRPGNVKESSINLDFDAIMRLTASAICATGLHFARGTVPGMQGGTILGHESPHRWHRCDELFIFGPPKFLNALRPGPCI